MAPFVALLVKGSSKVSHEFSHGYSLYSFRLALGSGPKIQALAPAMPLERTLKIERCLDHAAFILCCSWLGRALNFAGISCPLTPELT